MTQPLIRIAQIDSDELSLTIRTEIQTGVVLDDVSNVSVPSPIENQVLSFAGSPIGWIAVDNVAAGLGRAVLSSPTKGDFLVYQGSPSIWVNTSSISLTGDRIILSGVSVTGSPAGSPPTTNMNDTSLEISSTLPGIMLKDIDGPSNEKVWRFIVSGGDLVGEMRSDSGTSSNRWLEVIRNGIQDSEFSLFVGAEETAIRAIDGGAVELYQGGSKVVETNTAIAGGLLVNNLLTGGGFERVLTTSDLGSPIIIGLSNFDTDLRHIIEIADELQLDGTDVTVSSDGATITLQIEKEGGGDVRILFIDGVHTLDSDPTPATIALTAGTDTAPQINFVYILQSNKTLTVSTSGWPAGEHSRFATVLCQSAASLQTDGAYKVHVWTDHTDSEIAHIAFWLRSQSTTWVSGTALTPTVGAATFDVAVSTGKFLQLHPHDYPAFDTSTGSEVMIVNQNGTPFDRVGNLVSQITDANGGSMSNKYYNLVVWGVISEDSVDCQLMVNLPTGSYSQSARAVLDADATTVYDIPSDFKGVGFLIARLVVRHQAGSNTYTIVSNIDLRGKLPSIAAGGTTGGSVSSLGELSDVILAGGSGSPLVLTGDILYNDGTNWVNLARGTAGQVLTMGSPLIPSWQASSLIITETTVGGSPVVETTIASHATATYRSVEFIIQAVRGDNYHLTKILAIHDDTNVEFTEFGTLMIPSFFGSPATGSPAISGVQATYVVDVSGGNLRLLATPRGGTGNITFKVTSTLITV